MSYFVSKALALSRLCIILARYNDIPDYEYLAKCLRTILQRLNVKMDDPFDWELGYENLGKLRPPGSSSRRSAATAAFREKG